MKKLLLSVLLLILPFALWGCGDGMDDIRARMEAKKAQRVLAEQLAAKEGTEATAPSTAAPAETTAVPAVASSTQPAEKEDATRPQAEPQPTQLTEVEHRKVQIQNLKQIGKALRSYTEKTRRFPPRAGYGNDRSKDPSVALSWRVHLLPYLGMEDVYRKFNLNEAWDSATNLAAAEQIPDVYADPSGQAAAGCTRVLGIAGADTALGTFELTGFRVHSVERDMEVDLDSFLFAIEVAPQYAVKWSAPQDVEVNVQKNFTLPKIYDSGILAVWPDGAISELEPDLPGDQFRSACSIEGDSALHRRDLSHDAVDDIALLNNNSMIQEEDGTGESGIDQDGQLKIAAEDDDAATLVSTDGGRSEAERRAAVKLSRTDLVFQAYKTYLEEHRFFHAWQMHQAAMVLGDDDLVQKFAWAPFLKRPVYGYTVGLGIVKVGTEDHEHDLIPLDKLETAGIKYPYDQEAEQEFGAPVVLSLKNLRDLATSGKLGPWAQSVSTEKNPDKRNRFSAIKQSDEPILVDHFPGVLVLGEGEDNAYLLDRAQSEDLDLLLAITIRTSKDDQKFSCTVYDVQKRVKVGEADDLSLKSYIDFRDNNPLKPHPLRRWLAQQTEILERATNTVSLPKLPVEAVRNLLRERIKQPESRHSLADFLETKLYVDLGLLSGAEYEKLASYWSQLGDSNQVYSGDQYQKLQAVEQHLPLDWENPIQQRSRRDNDD